MKRDPLVSAAESLAARRPEFPLVVSATRQITCAGIQSLSEALGSTLVDLGTQPRCVVGLMAPNGPAFLAGLLAIRRAGAAALLLSHRIPSEEQGRIAQALGVSAFLRCASGWPEELEAWQFEPIKAGGRAFPTKTDAAVIKLSSGSTGVPRGVAISMEALMADDEALRRTMEIGDDDRLLATIPFPHSYGLSSLVLPALARGIRLIVPDHDGPIAPIEAAHAAAATVFPTVPAYLRGILALSSPPELPTSLRRVITAGEPIRPDTAAAFRERYGLGVRVFYGASECGGISYDRAGGAAERGTVGTPVDGVRLLIDAESDLGGRITVQSAAVASAYLPPSGDRLRNGRYTTDDLATWVDGELKLMGRVGDTINIRGKKVDPREVEAVLCRLEAIDEAYVVGAREGQGEPFVRAVIACRADAPAVLAVLEWCRRHLTDYKVPRSVVVVPALPRTDRGKIDRAALSRLEPGKERRTTLDV